jgi:hypothetical protein
MNCLWARLPGNGLCLTANKHVGAAPGGGSGAQLYGVVENQSTYVVKLKGNNQTTRVLCNEYLCGRVGELLGVPFGEHALVNVDTGLLPGGGVQPGTQCGTVYFPNAQTDLNQLRQAVNGVTFPSVLVFDAFIALRDSRQFLVYPSSGDSRGPRDMGAIYDQGHALTGSPGWTAQGLANDNLCTVADQLGLKQWFGAIQSYEPYLSCIEALGRSHFEQLVNEAPLAEWGVSNEEAVAVTDWLYRRRVMVRQAIAGHLA